MKTNYLFKPAFIFATILLLGVSGILAAQEKVDKNVSKTLKEITLKVPGIT